MSIVEILHGTIHALRLQARILVTSILGKLGSCSNPKLVVELHRGVDREKFLHTIELAGYAGDAIPIEQVGGEVPLYIEDHSYFFHKPHEAGI